MTRCTLIAVSLALIACNGAATPVVPKRPRRPGTTANAAATLPELAGPAGLPARVLAELPDGAPVWLTSRRAGRTLMVSHDIDQGWVSAVIGHSEAWQQVAPPSGESPPARLAWTGSDHTLIFAQPSDGAFELVAINLDDEGTPSKPVSVARETEQVIWVDILDSGGNPVLLWETSNGDASTVRIASWQDGSAGEATTAVHNVVGWHAVSGPRAALAYVDGARAGRVWLRDIAPDGTLSEAVQVSASPTALPDVQVASLKDERVLAWTDELDGDHHVYAATVRDGKTSGPTPAISRVGEQALVALQSNATHTGALLAWQASSDSAAREMFAGRLDGGQLAGKRLQLRYDATDGAPHFSAAGEGYAVVTLSEMRLRASAEADMAVAPHHLLLDRDLSIIASEPIRSAVFAPSGVPELLHGVNCDDASRCRVLATSSGVPRQLVEVDLLVRDSEWLPPAAVVPADVKPVALALGIIHELDEPVADLDAVTLRDGRTLLTWVTHHALTDPPEGAKAPAGAKLQLMFVTDGKPGEVKTLSTSAISIGGVSVAEVPATAPKINGKKQLAVIGWAGPNNEASQVFVTKVDNDGNKLRQRTVTKVRRLRHGIPNEVYDVDVAPDATGNTAVAWTDTRDGDPEIYVARVNNMLEKSLKDRRITRAKGASLEPQLSVRGRTTLVAWSELREPATTADVFAIALHTRSLEPSGSERRVFRSAGHSRTPAFSGGELSWIEEADADGPGEVRIVRLDDTGREQGPPRGLAKPNVAITSGTLSCDDNGCRSLLAGAVGGELSLLAADDGPLRVITSINGSSSQDVMLRGDASLEAIFFIDDRSAPGRTRIRRLAIGW